MANLFEGLLVVDFTTMLAGPMLSALLADYGAEVIKIEHTQGGDPTRGFYPRVDGKHSLTYVIYNRNKRSFAVDAKDPKGLEVLKKLITRADVFVEAFPAGTIGKLGLGYDVVRQLNPRIIMCSLSGFGQNGPYKERPGYDIIAQGLSGLMDITGEPDGPPIRSGTTLGDFVGAYNAFGAVCAALYSRCITGKGQLVDIALLDSLFAMTTGVEFPAVGETFTRTGNHHTVLAPYGVYNGREDSIIIAAVTEKQWSAVANAMKKPELITDPKFATNNARTQNLKELIRIIEEWLCSCESVDDALDLLIKAGVPSCKVMKPSDTLHDPQLIAREMVVDLPMPDDVREPKTIKARGNYMKFSDFKPQYKRAPLLGQDEEYVLKMLGYDDDAIAELMSKWVLK